jgi:TIR domain
VKGLDKVRHDGPSIIGIDTIYRSGGHIPEAFLRDAGVPENFITYMRSLVASPIEFYSCFISYSSKDHDFAERLHADLQTSGVRCWFAAEDLKIGDKFRTRIQESIRIYDKLMVVLTENSIQSPWVEEEVEAALEKERMQGKLMLFPIRLDDTVMDTDRALAASIRQTRHIGDFSRWKDCDAYKKSFERLLLDLNAERTD